MNEQIERKGDGGRGHPLCRLSREDLDLTAELLLKSGSLKDLASVYGVSYPTIRNRVDRVIERLTAIMEGRPPDPLTDLLAGLVERGEMSAATARLIRDTARAMSREGGATTDERGEISDRPPPEPAVEPARIKRFDWKPRPV